MEDKTYGIKTHLVEEFRELQISRQKSTMGFVGNCSLFINSAPLRVTVEAGNGIISITPFPLFAAGLVGYRIPPQRLNDYPSTVTILLHPALTIHLIFDTDDLKREFVGQLNLSEGSASASSSSPPSTNPTTDSGVENV